VAEARIMKERDSEKGVDGEREQVNSDEGVEGR
jgi:hypothetical protein